MCDEDCVSVPDDVAARWRRLVADAGGPHEAFRRLIAMAPAPPRLKAPAASRERTNIHVTVLLSASDAKAADNAAKASGFKRAEWIRALVAARLRRAPQWPPGELRANSAARYELQRMSNLMLHCAQSLGRDPTAADQLLRAHVEARRHLQALRCAMTGALLYWDVDDE